MTTHEPESASELSGRRFFAASMLANMVLVIVFNAFANAYLGRSPETAILTLFLWPHAFALGLAYAVASRGLMSVRVLVVLVGLTAPYLAVSIAPLMAPVVSRNNSQPKESRDQVTQRHMEFLQNYMGEPRSVIFVSLPYIVVEGGYSLALVSLRIPRENLDSATIDLKARLLGRKITATLPPDYLVSYKPDMRNVVTSTYARGKARSFGDVPAVIALDGVDVIKEIDHRWGRAKVR